MINADPINFLSYSYTSKFYSPNHANCIQTLTQLAVTDKGFFQFLCYTSNSFQENIKIFKKKWKNPSTVVQKNWCYGIPYDPWQKFAPIEFVPPVPYSRIIIHTGDNRAVVSAKNKGTTTILLEPQTHHKYKLLSEALTNMYSDMKRSYTYIQLVRLGRYIFVFGSILVIGPN